MLTIIESPLFTKLWPDGRKKSIRNSLLFLLQIQKREMLFQAQVAAGKSVGHVMVLENVGA
ncbi:MAG: hypothetical protein QX199_08675 [Methylococcaceae bacterium]